MLFKLIGTIMLLICLILMLIKMVNFFFEETDGFWVLFILGITFRICGVLKDYNS